MSYEKPHILVISQYFFPEQFRINDICCEWIKRGYQVTVITGVPNYPDGHFYQGYGLFKKKKEYWNNIHIVRLPIVSRGKSKARLCLNYTSFVLSGFFWTILTRIKADYTYIYEVSPMTQALVGCWYAKRKKIPCYLYVTDLWPESIEAITGIKNKLIIAPIEKMVRYIYANCNHIFVSSKFFIDSVAKKGVLRKHITYWPQYAEDCYYKIQDERIEKKENCLKILFAGNIGEAQGLSILPKAAEELMKSGYKVKFILLGNGRYRERLENLAKEYKVECMFSFLGQKSKEEVAKYMAECDVALISLAKKPVFALTVPAKTQSCMACGKPILVCADGEVRNIVEEAGCGLCAEAENIHEFVNCIKEFIGMTVQERNEMGKKAEDYYRNCFEKEKLLKQMDEYFKIRG